MSSRKNTSPGSPSRRPGSSSPSKKHSHAGPSHHHRTAARSNPVPDPSRFLPTTVHEMQLRGWDACDFIIVTGDAYVDHPSFGTALIGRLLEAEGFRVGIISQPAWDSCRDFTLLGPPRCAFFITSGNLDSMAAHYTAAGKPRSEDSCTPGGKAGKRPDRALIPYTSRARQAYGNVPVIIGGLEASLRRLSHYDYWSDRIRRSMLLDAKADLLVYGMAERAVREIARRLSAGEPVSALRDIPGTVYALRSSELDSRNSSLAATSTAAGLAAAEAAPLVELPSFAEVSQRDPRSNRADDQALAAYARSVQLRLLHENPCEPCRLRERYEGWTVVQNPPAVPLSESELDALYRLPFTRSAHPSAEAAGGVPALAEVRFSVTSTRGCFGECSFCAITTHQGKSVTARSRDSILEEIAGLVQLPGFKGYVHDIGGPTANFRGPACRRQAKYGPCPDRSCLFPHPCRALQDTGRDYLELLRQARQVPGVRKVFIRSGIRHDYLLACTDPSEVREYLLEIVRNHVGGQLKTAPEHVSSAVLDAMGKPGITVHMQFEELFREAGRRAGLEQYIIPYFISGHPGSTLADAVMLAEYLRDRRFIPDQVQDFYPTPGTVSTCMYATGRDPRPGRDFAPVHVPKGREKRLQRALLHFHKPEHAGLVREALRAAGREDLIGSGPRALVPAEGRNSRPGNQRQQQGRSRAASGSGRSRSGGDS